jgi:hypothetical protein
MAPPMSVPKRSDDAPSESGGITQEQLDAAKEETAKAKRAQAAAEARVSDAAGDPEAIANAEAAAKAEAEVKAATEAATTLLNTKAAILKAFQDIQLQLTNTPTEQSDAIKRIIDELAKTITIVADYSTKYTDTQKNTVSETVANTNPEWQTVIQDDGTVYYFKEPPIGSRWLPDDTIAAAEVTKDPVLAGAETLAEGIVVHKNRYPNGENDAKIAIKSEDQAKYSAFMDTIKEIIAKGTIPEKAKPDGWKVIIKNGFVMYENGNGKQQHVKPQPPASAAAPKSLTNSSAKDEEQQIKLNAEAQAKTDKNIAAMEKAASQVSIPGYTDMTPEQQAATLKIVQKLPHLTDTNFKGTITDEGIIQYIDKSDPSITQFRRPGGGAPTIATDATKEAKRIAGEVVEKVKGGPGAQPAGAPPGSGAAQSKSRITSDAAAPPAAELQRQKAAAKAAKRAATGIRSDVAGITEAEKAQRAAEAKAAAAAAKREELAAKGLRFDAAAPPTARTPPPMAQGSRKGGLRRSKRKDTT